MTIDEYHKRVDEWIKTHGVRYFEEKTNTLILMEEVGEFARLVSRIYGEQSFKSTEIATDQRINLADEWADILFVMACLANQTGINVEEAIERNFNKKTIRDKERHLNNNKLN